MPVLGPSGASAHLRGVAAALAEQGTTALVARREDARGARVAWDHPIYADIGAAWEAEGPFNLLWERHSLRGEAGRRLADQRGLFRLVEVNAPLARERARYAGLRRWAREEAWEADSLRAADRVVVVSPWLADWAVGLGVQRRKIRVVPNGSALEPAPPADLGLKGPVFGVFGSWRPWIGLERLAAWLDALPSWSALVVGEGQPAPPAHPRLRALSTLAPGALAAAMAACDVVVDPSPATEAPWRCPLRVVDALAVGVPVVGADRAATRGLLAGGGGLIAEEAAWPHAIQAAAALPQRARPRTWARVVAEALGEPGA